MLLLVAPQWKQANASQNAEQRRRPSSRICTRTLASIPSMAIDFVKYYTSPARSLTKHVHDLVRHHDTNQAVAISTTSDAVAVILGPDLPHKDQSRHDLDHAQVGP